MPTGARHLNVQTAAASGFKCAAARAAALSDAAAAQAQARLERALNAALGKLGKERGGGPPPCPHRVLRVLLDPRARRGLSFAAERFQGVGEADRCAGGGLAPPPTPRAVRAVAAARVLRERAAAAERDAAIRAVALLEAHVRDAAAAPARADHAEQQGHAGRRDLSLYAVAICVGWWGRTKAAGAEAAEAERAALEAIAEARRRAEAEMERLEEERVGVQRRNQ